MATYSSAAGQIAAPSAGTWLRRVITSPYLTLISRLVLGLVFALAGLTKFGVPAAFTNSINSYEMPLPDFFVWAMANGLPAIEIGLGIWLLIGLFTRVSGAVATGLIVVFLIALIQAWLRGLSPECGCFTSGADANPLGTAIINALGPVGTWLTTGKVGPVTTARDLVLLLMGVHLILAPTVFSVDSIRQGHVVEEEYDDEQPLTAEELAAQEQDQPTAQRHS